MALLTCDFFSESLERGTSMTVVLPQPTEDQIGVAEVAVDGPPPVLYLLHGLSDDHTAWLRYTSIERYATAAGLAVVGVIENMSDFTCDHGERYELFGAGGGQTLAAQIGVPLLGQIPLEAAVARGGDTGRPVALADIADRGPAAAGFTAVAARLDEVVPGPTATDVDMSGCTARLLTAVSAALDGS